MPREVLNIFRAREYFLFKIKYPYPIILGRVDLNILILCSAFIVLLLACLQDSREANGKNCAVFHTNAKFAVLIPATI